MTDLRARLEAGLAGTYRIERELGGGGMSRVFVAEELALGRHVVLKVLPPDLSAGLSTDRFRREIKLAAGLQHPAIVPLLAAGDAGELLYYAMPFVDGESLAERIARDGRLPTEGAAPLLRDLADALAYAHRRGIVHRDIKPANILLSGEHALVTDFGVAKAVSDATGEMALTGTGLAIGTPAYMAPEQVAADPSADARVDVYAFGVVAYEMLAGRSPYGDLSPRAMLAAHVSQEPIDLDSVAPGVAPGLTRLVMRCLSKDPAQRPADGAAVLSELAAVAAVPAPRRGAGLRRRRAAVVVGAAALAVAAWLFQGPRGATRALDPNLVAVFPFRVSGAPAELGEGLVDLLAARLTGEGGPRAVDPQSAISAWSRSPDRNEADASRLAVRFGAARAVIGSIVATGGERISVTARLIDAVSRRPLAPETVDGPTDSLAWLVDRLAIRLLARSSGETEARLPDLTSRSPDAIRAYLAGQAAYRRGAYAEALELYERAIATDSSFALAALAAAAAAHWITEDSRRDAAMAVAEANVGRLSPNDRLLLRLRAAVSGVPVAQPWRNWLLLADSATRVTPDRAEAWFELGDVYFHEGRALGIRDARLRAKAAFARATELDSAFVAPLEHLIELAAMSGDTSEVRRLAGLYFRVDSIGDLADFMRWRVAVTLGDSGAQAAVRARMNRMTVSTLFRIAGTAQLDAVGLQDVTPALEAAARQSSGPSALLSVLDAATAANRGHGAKLDSSMTLAERAGFPRWRIAAIRVGAGAFWLPDSGLAGSGAKHLESVLSSAGRERTVHESMCSLGEFAFARGDARRLDRMRAALRDLVASQSDTAAIEEARICALKLDAGLAILRNPEAAGDAVRQFELAIDDMPPTSPADHLILALMHERRGDHRASLAAAQRREHHWIGGLFFLTAYLLQEARMARIVGEDSTATRAYQHYLRLRTDPDPALRPALEQVRGELAELLGEPRRH